MNLLSRILALFQRRQPTPQEAPVGPLPETAVIPLAGARPGERTLRRGMSGPDVEWLQAKIGEAPDGIFGRVTEAAVVAWQIDNGLMADGVVGPATWRKLNAARVTAPPVFQRPGLTAEQHDDVGVWMDMLRDGGLAPKDIDDWASVLAAETAGKITTPEHRAAFLANGWIETAGLTRLIENLYYTTPAAMMRAWKSRFPTVESTRPFLRNPDGLAERVYGGRMGNGPAGSGDATRAIGRGFFMLTGMDNYRRQAAILGMSVDALIEALKQRETAVRSAVLYWEKRGCARIFDEGGLSALRISIQGGDRHLEEVTEVYQRVLAAARS